MVDLFAVRETPRGVEAAFSSELGAALEFVAAVGVGWSRVVILYVCESGVSMIIYVFAPKHDLPSGRLFRASFMARMVSAIWICCAAMTAV